MIKVTLISSVLLLVLSGTLLAGSAASPKEVVTSFFELGFVERKPVKAANTYISGKKYIQHNPHGTDGRQAFIEGFAKYILESSYECELKRAIAEDELVAVHSHCKETLSDKGAALVDIFRVENGLIVEYWDVEQAIPEESENTNTMF